MTKRMDTIRIANAFQRAAADGHYEQCSNIVSIVQLMMALCRSSTSMTVVLTWCKKWERKQMEPKDRISRVKPIWERLGLPSEDAMTKQEALYYKLAAKAIADMRWEDYKRDKENGRNKDR